jgi:ABC-type Fe3+ transport system permease subunit
MKKTLRTALAGLVVVPALLLGVVTVIGGTSAPVNAASIQDGADLGKGNGPDTLDGQDGVITTVINIMLYVIGAVSVIMLIYGGIRYTTSGGNSNSVTAAKNTILYALIGLVVAIFAYAIVNWVLGELLG